MRRKKVKLGMRVEMKLGARAKVGAEVKLLLRAEVKLVNLMRSPTRKIRRVGMGRNLHQEW